MEAEPLSLVSSIELLVRGILIILGLAPADHSPAIPPYQPAPPVKSALLFIETEGTNTEEDLACITTRLAGQSYKIKIVELDNGRAVLHVTGNPWTNSSFFKSILVDGRLDIGEVDESETWKKMLFPAGTLPDSITLETMAPFDKPTFVSDQKILLTQQFPKLKKRGYIPFVHCDRNSRGMEKCALQVLKRTLKLEYIHQVSTTVYVSRESFASHLEMKFTGPFTGDTATDDAALQDFLSMTRATFVMNGEAFASHMAVDAVGEEEMSVVIEPPLTRDMNDPTFAPAVPLPLQMLQSCPPLQNKWKLVHVQSVNTPVTHFTE